MSEHQRDGIVYDQDLDDSPLESPETGAEEEQAPDTGEGTEEPQEGTEDPLAPEEKSTTDGQE